MYPNRFLRLSVPCAAAIAATLPVFLAAPVHAAQIPDDDMWYFTAPSQLPESPFLENGDDDTNVLFSLDGYDGFGEASTVETLEAQLKSIDTEIKRSEERVETARKSDDKVKQSASEARLDALKKARESVTKSIERVRRFAPLQKMVDVKFENATVAQAAEALSRASGVTIRVDKSIPDTTRLTVEARKVRLATVLESAARQAGLIIDPINLDKGDIGVELTAPPMLRVNDTVQRFPRSSSPWSGKWGTPPTRRLMFSTYAPYPVAAMNSLKDTIVSTYTNGVSAEAIGGLARNRAYTAAIAATGQQAKVMLEGGTTIEIRKPGTVTVTEPGKNDKEEMGIWQTVYTLKNGELIQQSRVWQKK